MKSLIWYDYNDAFVVLADTDIKNHKLLYLLRNYDSFEFVKGVKKLERKMFDLTNDFDKEIFIIDKISELIGIDSVKNEYKTNKIEDNVETILPKFKELYERYENPETYVKLTKPSNLWL